MIMTNGRKRRIVIGMLVALLVLIAGSFGILVYSVMTQHAVVYGAKVYQPERRSYCPGEDMTYNYVRALKTKGPVEIVRSWCRVEDNVCLLSRSVVHVANVITTTDEIEASITRTIPVSSYMRSGETWAYTHSIRGLGTSHYDMYIVPFVIEFGCAYD